MIFTISKFIAGLFGWDISVVQKRVLLALMILVVIAVIVSGLWIRSCLVRPAKLNEKQIQKAQKAIAEQDRKEMVEILAESELGEKKINANLANAELEKLKTLGEARKKAHAMSNDELAAELERRLNQ